jgi:small-conductance mechanosensitive channel
MKGKAQVDPLTDAIRSLLEATGLPRSALLSIVILVVGLLVAVVFDRAGRKLTKQAAGLLAGIGRSTAPAFDTMRTERIVGRTLYWLVIALAVMAATEALGLPIVTAWLSGVASYVPRIAVAMLIWGLGLIAGRAVRHVVTGAASSARMPAARRLGRLVEIAIWVGTSLVAVEQLGIEISFLKATLTVALAALLGGAAIAFGLGGQRVAANILSAHYVQKLYQVGQTIRLDGIEGRIARITETAVILESEEGEVAIPASAITDGRSLLVLKPGGR